MHTETESEPTNGESEKPKLAVVTKNLKIKLTEDEFVDRAKQLSKAIAEYNAVEAEKKSVAKDYADKLAGIDSNVQELRKVIEESAELRDVEVTVERDLFAKKVITRLASTGEIVEERAMQEHDRQLELQVAAQQASEGGDVIAMELPKTTEAERRAHEEHGELTEEQRFADTPEEAEAMRDARLADEFSDGHETAELRSMGLSPAGNVSAATAAAPSPVSTRSDLGGSAALRTISMRFVIGSVGIAETSVSTWAGHTY